MQFYYSNQMDTLNVNMNHNKSVKFNNIVHDTMKSLNGVPNKTTTHNTIGSSRSISCSGSNHVNEIKEDVRHSSSSEVNNNNHTDDDCTKHTSTLNRNNAKNHIDKIQQPFDQNSAKTNGYVNGHSNHNRCTIVQNFQNYHKPNR